MAFFSGVMFTKPPVGNRAVPCHIECDSMTGKAEVIQAASLWLLLWLQREAKPSNSLIKEHVSVGRQHLVQAGFAYRIVWHPQPLAAEGRRAARWGGAAAVGDEMSWVHVTVVNQHRRELEKVLCRTGRNGTNTRGLWSVLTYTLCGTICMHDFWMQSLFRFIFTGVFVNKVVTDNECQKQWKLLFWMLLNRNAGNGIDVV